MLNSTHVILQDIGNTTDLSPVSAETGEYQAAAVAEFIIPEQFFSTATESSSRWSGERRLLFAVLQDAVASLLRYRNATTRRSRRLFSEDKEWFWAQDRDDLFSFESICDRLNLDPDYIRMGLRRSLQAPANPFTGQRCTVSPAECHFGLDPVTVEEKAGDRGMPCKTIEQLT